MEVAHLVGGLEEPDEGLADASHRLRVGRVHRDDAAIVEDVLGRHGLGTDAALRERDVLRDPGVQVVRDHQHVEVFVQCVDRIGTGRVGR